MRVYIAVDIDDYSDVHQFVTDLRAELRKTTWQGPSPRVAGYEIERQPRA